MLFYGRIYPLYVIIIHIQKNNTGYKEVKLVTERELLETILNKIEKIEKQMISFENTTDKNFVLLAESQEILRMRDTRPYFSMDAVNDVRIRILQDKVIRLEAKVSDLQSKTV